MGFRAEESRGRANPAPHTTPAGAMFARMPPPCLRMRPFVPESQGFRRDEVERPWHLHRIYIPALPTGETMKLGLHIPSTTWAGGAQRLGSTLADVVQAAESAGFENIDVGEHPLQHPP